MDFFFIVDAELFPLSGKPETVTQMLGEILEGCQHLFLKFGLEWLTRGSITNVKRTFRDSSSRHYRARGAERVPRNDQVRMPTME